MEVPDGCKYIMWIEDADRPGRFDWTPLLCLHRVQALTLRA